MVLDGIEGFAPSSTYRK